MTAAPHPEPEIVGEVRHLAAAAVALPRNLSPEEIVDTMLPAVIEQAGGYAERAFLAIIATSDHLPGRITADRADRIVLEAIADMQHEASRIADELQATAEQRHRLAMGQAVLFDLRMAELETRALLSGGTA